MYNRCAACGQYVLGQAFCFLQGLDEKKLTVCIIHGGVDPHFFSGRLFLELCGKTQPPASWDRNRDPLFIERLLHCSLEVMLVFRSLVTRQCVQKVFTPDGYFLGDIGWNQPPAMLIGKKFECKAYCFDYCHTFIF